MNPTTRRTVGPAPLRLVAVLAGIAAWLPAGEARAQWGWGWGAFYNPEDASQTTNFLNQRSLAAAQGAYAARAGGGGGGLTEPSYQVRDDTFFQKYDATTRAAMVDQVARDPGAEGGTVRRTTASAPPAPAQPVVVHLAGFFDASRQLVWPREAPTAGDLEMSRKTADRAALSVLDAYNARGIAPVSMATEARQKLLDYGRPALRYVREHSTTAIADSFHAFLLSLYANLGLAATTPKAPPADRQGAR
jgi:hypothetical protein